MPSSFPPPQPRSTILQTPREVHGAITPAELARLGMDPGQVIDFSANINPYGPAPGVRSALTQVAIAAYPDPEARNLRQALAEHVRQPPARILPGHGASELIWLIALAFLDPGDRAAVLGPTYGEYARAARLMGAQTVSWLASPDDDFAVHPDAIAQMLGRVQPRLVFLCHPNNPTGQPYPLGALAQWAAAHPTALFVVDEAYLPFLADGRSALSLEASNILVLRSMTKDHALAGLRLGYAVGPDAVIDALAQVQPPWSVHAMAQAAGLASLAAQSWVDASLAQVREDARALRRALRALGWQPHPSATHFFLLPVEDGVQVREGLLRQGVVVRDAASFGLPGHVRIAARTPAENARLLEALGRAIA